MKKQTSAVANHTKRNKKNTGTKTTSHYKYTEADLGEDILNISICSVYPAVKQLVSNIYRRSYEFQS